MYTHTCTHSNTCISTTKNEICIHIYWYINTYISAQPKMNSNTSAQPKMKYIYIYMYIFKHIYQHNQKWIQTHQHNQKWVYVFLATHTHTYTYADICVWIKAPWSIFLHTTKNKIPQSKPKKMWEKWQNKMGRRLFIFARHCVRPQGTWKGSFVVFWFWRDACHTACFKDCSVSFACTHS